MERRLLIHSFLFCLSTFKHMFLLITCVSCVWRLREVQFWPHWNQACSSSTSRSAILMGLSNWARPIPFQHSPSRWVVDICQPHLVTCQVTVFCSQSFRQAICNLLLRADMSKADDPSIKFLLNEEAINFHMFCPIMLNWVIRNTYS
jgi:hypothetical protein